MPTLEHAARALHQHLSAKAEASPAFRDWLAEDGGAALMQALAAALTPGAPIQGEEPATSAVVKVTCSLGNVAYIRHTERRGWACTLANGIPASMSYAGVLDDETGCVIALERAKTPADVLRIIQARIARRYTAELA